MYFLVFKFLYHKNVYKGATGRSKFPQYFDAIQFFIDVATEEYDQCFGVNNDVIAAEVVKQKNNILKFFKISFVAETNRRLYPHLNKHLVPETIEVEEDNEMEPSAKKIKTRHLNFVNSFVDLDAPTSPKKTMGKKPASTSTHASKFMKPPALNCTRRRKTTRKTSRSSK